MKIEENLIQTTTIEDLADKYKLTMVISERSPLSEQPKFYARFKNVEEKNGGILISSYGNGSTKEEAIKDYANIISHKNLVYNAYTENRVEFNVGYVTYDS